MSRSYADQQSLTLPKSWARARVRRPKRPSPRRLFSMINMAICLVWIAHSVIALLEGDLFWLPLLPVWIFLYAIWRQTLQFRHDVHWLEWTITAFNAITVITAWI